MTIQGLIVMAIAALAAGFLAWRVVAPFVRGSASPGCHGCSTPCELKTAARRMPCGESTAAAPHSAVTSERPLRRVVEPLEHPVERLVPQVRALRGGQR